MHTTTPKHAPKHAAKHAASTRRWLRTAPIGGILTAAAVLTLTAGSQDPPHSAGSDAGPARPASGTAGTSQPTAPQPVRRASTVARREPQRPSLPAAPRTAAETVQAAEASTYNVPGQCLGWSREQADVPSLYDAASTAWEHASGRHPGDPAPPAGAAVYWTGGSNGYGHVAISLGNGLVRSSDGAGQGVVGTVPLGKITEEWGLDYAGWASSINGYTIRGIADA